MDAIVSVLGALLPLAKAYPWFAVAASVAGFVVMAQPLLRAIVRWTPTKVDDAVAEVVFKVANLLTPRKVKRGERVEPAAPVEPPKPVVHPETHSTDTDTDNVPTEQ